MRLVKVILIAAMLVSALGLMPVASAQTTQTWDNSGNGLLKGVYYIRQVIWWVGDNSGNLYDGASAYGQITFSGDGTYSFNGSFFDFNAKPQTQTFTTSGNYTISSSGYGFMDSLYIDGETIYGLVSNGIFVGSSTENLSGNYMNDLVIAAQLANPQPTADTFKGNYTMIDFDTPDGTPSGTRSSLFTMTADGLGTLTGTTAGTGFIGFNAGAVTHQNLSNVKYLFSNGGANVQFSGSITPTDIGTTLIAGNHYLYFSPDGNFFFGGSPNGFDMIVGVRTPTAAPSAFGGLYYQAGMSQDLSQLFSAGFANLNSEFGSFKGGSGTVLNHQRVFSPFNNNPFDFTFKDGYTFNTDGSTDDTVTSEHYIYGNNGAIRIGLGLPPFLGASVAIAAPSLSGPGVFLNPQGVVNSASFAQFTSSISPGEFVTLFGTGLSNQDAVGPLFPTTLGGVQVTFNGVPAPLYYVLKAGAISCLVPYEITGPVVNIQVINNGAKSNVVSTFLGLTSPGMFTQTQDGVGYISAQHTTDFSTITPSNPAKVGEVIAVYLTGLGATTPAIPTGSITPGTTFTNATTLPNVYIGGVQAPAGFAGLTPGLIGLYQLNVTIPSGLTAGDNIFEVTGTDSDNFESKIPIASASARLGPEPDARQAAKSPTTSLMRPSHPHITRIEQNLPNKAEPLSGGPMRRQ
jgi:uncharacterized protein (TIGR03437 family)